MSYTGRCVGSVLRPEHREEFRAGKLKKAINIDLAGTFLPKHTALEMERLQNFSFAWSLIELAESYPIFSISQLSIYLVMIPRSSFMIGKRD